MAKLVNDKTANFKDKTVYLDNDLDLSGHEWISIGDGANTAWGSFQGIFDGQSHVVYNLYSHEGLKSGKTKTITITCIEMVCSVLSTMQLCKISALKNADIVIPMNDTSTYGKAFWWTDDHPPLKTVILPVPLPAVLI